MIWDQSLFSYVCGGQFQGVKDQKPHSCVSEMGLSFKTQGFRWNKRRCFFFDCEKFNIAAYASHGEARTGVMYKTINEITRKYFLNRLVTLNLKHYKEI